MVSPSAQDSEPVYKGPAKEGLEKEKEINYESIHSFTWAYRRCLMNTYYVTSTEDTEGKKTDKQKAKMKPFHFRTMAEKDTKQINTWEFNYNDDM